MHRRYILLAIAGVALIASGCNRQTAQREDSSAASERAAAEKPAPPPAAQPPQAAQPQPQAAQQPAAAAARKPDQSAAARPRTDSSGLPPQEAPNPQASEMPPMSAAPAAPAPAPVVPQPPPPPPPRVAHLDAGTSIVVRTTTALSTKTAQPGATFTATLENPITAGDWTVAPRGATVTGKVVESDPGGRVSGKAHISVQLTSLTTADGRRVAIATEPVAQEAESSKGKDAKRIGIGAGVGAAVGAIAGGGKGAAIGAGVGGGAGTAATMATRGKPAEIPSEAALTFRLSQPVSIREKQKGVTAQPGDIQPAPEAGDQQ